LDGHLLGDELANLEPPYSAPPMGVPITQADYRWLSLLARHPRGIARLFSLGRRWLAGRITGKHLLSMGQALAAGLRAGLLQADVPVWLNTPHRSSICGPTAIWSPASSFSATVKKPSCESSAA
jgi:3-oxosteroid 1-dehydrogenase